MRTNRLACIRHYYTYSTGPFYSVEIMILLRWWYDIYGKIGSGGGRQLYSWKQQIVTKYFTTDGICIIISGENNTYQWRSVHKSHLEIDHLKIAGIHKNYNILIRSPGNVANLRARNNSSLICDFQFIPRICVIPCSVTISW